MPVEPQSLPDSMRDRFAALEQHLWRQETTVAACGAVGSLASAGLLFFSDRLWDTPPVGRTISWENPPSSDFGVTSRRDKPVERGIRNAEGGVE